MRLRIFIMLRVGNPIPSCASSPQWWLTARCLTEGIVGNCNSFPIRHRGQELLELSDPVDPNDYGLNVTSPAPAWNVMNVSLETNSTIA